MSTRDELAAERHQAEDELRRITDELASLERRHDEVLVLVAERAQGQRDAALEVERSGGGDSKALTRAVAGHQEAQARLDALVEVVAEKRAEVESAHQQLSVALRAEAEDRRMAEIAAATAELSRIGGEVRDHFQALALSEGRYLVAYERLLSLDQAAAVEMGREVGQEKLDAAMLAAGCRPLQLVSGANYGMICKAMAGPPEPEQPGRAA